MELVMLGTTDVQSPASGIQKMKTTKTKKDLV